MRYRLGVLFAVAMGWCGVVQAQQTNQAAFIALGTACLGPLPGDVQSFYLDAPSQMPYLRSALIQTWQQEGRRIFVSDTTAALLPTLRYTIEAVAVDYARQGRKQVARTVSLGLRYALTTADGEVLRDAPCSDTFQDVLSRKALAEVETPTFPETQAPPPPPGGLGRYLEPALLTAATAVSVFLFFTLRSDRADDG